MVGIVVSPFTGVSLPDTKRRVSAGQFTGCRVQSGKLGVVASGIFPAPDALSRQASCSSGCTPGGKNFGARLSLFAPDHNDGVRQTVRVDSPVFRLAQD